MSAHAISHRAGMRPSVAQGDRHRARRLSGLSPDRNVQLTTTGDHLHDISIANAETFRGGGCNRQPVSPRESADRIGKFLQPRIVGVATVAQRNSLVGMKLVLVGSARGSGPRLL